MRSLLSGWIVACALGASAFGAEAGDAYEWFNQFCIDHFGAEKEPLVYQFLGKELKVVEGGTWVHASRNSACIAWETLLPATSWVEFGPTPALGRKTPPTERCFYIHVHYLTGLDPATRYHYRMVSVDERGNRLASDVATLTTAPAAEGIDVPGSLPGPPYRLDKPGASYVVTRDITAPDAALQVLADGLTLDLNGHTVAFAAAPTGDLRFANGVMAGRDPAARVPDAVSKFRLFNGRILQSPSPAAGKFDKPFGLNCLFLSLADAEIAGITADYRAPQSWGGVLWNPTGALDVHHNVLVDRGTRIANRHGAAARALGISEKAPAGNAFRIHHNLIKRTRQNGLGGAHEISHNEVCVDSWSTNSFAIQPVSVPGVPAGEVHHNRVLATGFNPYALGWAHLDLDVHDNLVQMFGIDAKTRWGERWGDINMCEGFRVTNYSKGGQKRDHLVYWHNLIVLRGQGGSELRGTGFFSDDTITGLVFRDNTVKVEALDDKTEIVSCIATHGQPAKADTCLPVVYRGCTLISNLCNVRFGDRYGKGSNHQFIGCRFERTGADPRYHTFVFDGLYWCKRGVVQDCTFGPGTRYNDVFWRRTGSPSFYDVKWTLTLSAPAGSAVLIRDAAGAEEFSGKVGADGRLAVVLTQCRISPPKGFRNSQPNTAHAETAHTPHTLTLTLAGAAPLSATLRMDRPRTLELREGKLVEAEQ